MVIKKVDLEIVIGVTSAIPETDKPEVAFAGKSNVGKSSLINSLMNRKSYARISAQPGKTQTINFYNINDLMYLVDLPGYGYANANEAVKAKWGKMIEKYLHTSRQLRQVFLLIDIRHDPSNNDRIMYDWIISNGFRPVIIATKLDKINRSQVPKHVKMIRDGLGMQKDDILLPFSSLTKQGLEEIWQTVDNYVLSDETGRLMELGVDMKRRAKVTAESRADLEAEAEQNLETGPADKSVDNSVDKFSGKAEVKSGTKPAGKARAKSGEKPTGKVRTKTGEKPAGKVRTKAGARPATKAGAKAGAKSGTGAAAIAKARREARREGRENAKAEERADSRTTAKAGTKHGTRAEGRTTAKTGAKPGTRAEGRTTAKAGAKSGTRQDSRTTAKAGAKSGTRQDGRTTAKAGAKSGTRQEGRTTAKAGAKPGAKPKTRYKK